MMKRIFIIGFLLIAFVVRAQIVPDSVRPFNCYHDGAIFLDLVPSSSFVDNWYFEDEILGWVEADTMVAVQLSNSLDTLITQQCGSYKVVISADTAFFFIGCPLGSRGSHLNVKCFGDSTGMLKRVAHSGTPPYLYEWYKNGALYVSGNNDTLFDNLLIGSYKIVFSDSIGCSDSILTNVISPSTLILDTISINDLNCSGVNTGRVSCSFSGGKKYSIGERYDYYIINMNSNDTISWVTRDSVSSNFTSGLNPYHITFDSLFAGDYILSVVDSFGCFLIDTVPLGEPLLEYLEVELIALDSVLPCISNAFTLINVVISGGTAPYSIEWSDGDINQQRYVGVGYYQVDITDANGCFSKDSIVIMGPSSSLIVEIELISSVTCSQGASVAVNASGGTPYLAGSPYTYLWSGPNNFSATTPAVDSLLPGTYIVYVRDTCGFVSDTIHLMDYELITSINYDTLSHIAEVQIASSTSPGPFVYEWLDTLYNHTNSRFPLFDSISPFLCGENIYFVTTTDLLNNCSVTNSVLVPTDNMPLGIVDFYTTNIDTVNLPNLWGTPPYYFLWNDSLASTTNYGYPCPNPDSSWVEILDYNDCRIIVKFLIDEIIITLDPQDVILECDIENLDVDLKASATGGTGDYSFEWWDGTTENPINLGMSPGDFSVTVFDANGCIADTVFEVAVMTSECIPNVFTPNGDEINDSWSLEDTFLYADSRVRIYGRFGKLLFESIGYHEKWDGTNFNGNDVPDGVYFYSIDIGHGVDQINGTVTILR